ncbi:hypothetical protein GCM10023094_09520 [Rhodococcus olei]|uniref:GmrSD restriction endonucleases C-terminal domain-containing protein n=1 Tax=Rhodococcus olei TaxID=2161675 RepID=A0ABP8NXS8_9NOCA
MRITRRRTAAWVSAGAFAAIGGAVAPAPPRDQLADHTPASSEPPPATSTLPTTTSVNASTNVAEPTTSQPTPMAAPAPVASADTPDAATAAQDRLETLPVKGRAPMTGYDRKLFGQTWSDDVTVDGGHNGCDTRNDILRRDLREITLKPGTNGCTVATGVLDDPYTGTTIAFTRVEDTSNAVEIDHVVALADAGHKGAQQLDERTRRDFANDPLNLQAVDGPTNQRKGDGDAATWIPPNPAYRCTYVARQIAVKATYRLWVTAPGSWCASSGPVDLVVRIHAGQFGDGDLHPRLLLECGATGLRPERLPRLPPPRRPQATTRLTAPSRR